MIAVETLSAGWQTAFYAVAVVVFLGAAVGVVIQRVNLIALGLAVAFFPFFWNALAGT